MDKNIIKFTLRLPEYLHAKLNEQAKSNYRSLNGEIVAVLEKEMNKDK